jgi:hypothetical protein
MALMPTRTLEDMNDAPDPAAALDFDDPLSRPSRDDTDLGWGDERGDSRGDAAADLARFLAEKPPHHL